MKSIMRCASAATGPDREAVGLERFARAAFAFAVGHFGAATVVAAVIRFALGNRVHGGVRSEVMLFAVCTVPPTLVFGCAALLSCARFHRAEPRVAVSAAFGAAVALLYFLPVWQVGCFFWLTLVAASTLAGLFAALVGGPARMGRLGRASAAMVPDRATVGLERFARAAFAFAGGHVVAGTVMTAISIFALREWDPALGASDQFMLTALLLAVFTVPATLVFGATALLLCALFYRAEPRGWVAAACGAALPALYYFVFWAAERHLVGLWVLLAAAPAIAGLVAALIGGRFRP